MFGDVNSAIGKVVANCVTLTAATTGLLGTLGTDPNGTVELAGRA